MEPIEEDEFEEILDRQENRCAGCNEPLTKAGADWASHTLWCEILENEGEEPREGFLRYKKARSLGGSRQELEDLEFMCIECMGTLTRSVRLPSFLVAKAAEWVESHQRHQDLHDRDYDVRSFNHLVRVAIERFISTEDEQKENFKLADAAKNLEMKLSKWMESMPEELARYSSPTVDYEMDGMLFEVKSKRIDDKRQGEDSGPSDVV